MTLFGIDVSTERWCPIAGFGGIYEVSDYGRVRSTDRHVTDSRGAKYFRRGRLLKAAMAKKGGYRVVNLGHPGKVAKIDILVLEAFVGPRPVGDTHSRHLNDNPADNRLNNLAWGTRSQNYIDAVENGKNLNARKTHCKWGHPFTGDNTKLGSSANGRPNRTCRECARRRAREWARQRRSM